MPKFITKPPIRQFTCEHGHVEVGEDGAFEIEAGSPIIGALEGAGYAVTPLAEGMTVEIEETLPPTVVARIRALETEVEIHKKAAKEASDRADNAEAVALALRGADAERQAREATEQQEKPPAEPQPPAEGEKQEGEQPAVDPKASTGAKAKQK